MIRFNKQSALIHFERAYYREGTTLSQLFAPLLHILSLKVLILVIFMTSAILHFTWKV